MRLHCGLFVSLDSVSILGLEGTNAEVAARLNDADTGLHQEEMAQLLAERGFTDLSWATVATYRANQAALRWIDDEGGGAGDVRA